MVTWIRVRFLDPLVSKRTVHLQEQVRHARSERDSAREREREHWERLSAIRDGVTEPLEWNTTDSELYAMWEDLSREERRTAINLFIGWRARKAGA